MGNIVSSLYLPFHASLSLGEEDQEQELALATTTPLLPASNSLAFNEFSPNRRLTLFESEKRLVSARRHKRRRQERADFPLKTSSSKIPTGVKEGENHNSLFLSKMDDPITISSSDSDLDFERDSDDDAFSTNASAAGHGGFSGNVFPSQSANGGIPRPFDPSHSIPVRNPQHPLNVAGSGFQRNAAGCGFQRKFSEHKRHSVDPLDKQPFSSPFHFSASNTKPSNLRDGTNDSGYTYPFPAAPGFTNGFYEKHKSDNDGTGILPPWMRGFPTSSGHHASPVDPFRNGDERIGGTTDERSVFQEAIQDHNQPKQEAELPDGLLSVTLLRHQKIALAWMRHKEARPFCVGGILADDQGLGKTISTIALIQMERHSERKSKSEDRKIQIGKHLDAADRIVDLDVVRPEDSNGIVDLDDIKPEVSSNGVVVLDVVKREASKAIVNLDDIKPEVSNDFESERSSSQQSSSNQRPAAGTLVVCPATVLRQWARELNDKVTEEAKLKVLIYHGSNRTKDPSELASYDVVLTTYALVANEVPKQPLIDEDDADGRYGSSYSHGLKRKKPSSSSKKGKKGKKGLDSCSFDSGSGTLAKVRWLRVVLDEAQTIKNHRTQAARACCGLRAKKRWCLSGTPVQNSIGELFSYFRFLKCDPYSSYKAFCDGIKGPISRDEKSGYQKLQVVLRTVMLRRTKGTLIDGKPIISLPPKYIKLKSLDFTSEEREFYTKLETDSQTQFEAYNEAGTISQNYANILLMLLRLRQACDHPALIFGGSNKKTDSIQSVKQLPKDKLTSLLNHLQGSGICQICDDPPEDAVISICGHVFCDQCVLDHLAGDDDTCPAKKCKEQLSNNVIFSEANLRSCLKDGSESSLTNGDQRDESSSIYSRDYTSSKIRTALEILQSLGKKESVPCIDLDGPAEDVNVRTKVIYPCIDLDGSTEDDAPISHPAINVRTEVINPCIDLDGSTEDDALISHPAVNAGTKIVNHVPSGGRQKAIVFSQWTRMLDLMETSLQRYGICYRRLDGKMSLNARDNAVREFNLNPEVDVMLMSLKAGNLGLNMIAACHVILLDLWWNPTTEDQAIDRAHRIGQTRAVTVSRLTVKDTVEDRILTLQDKKRKMVASAFGEENGGMSSRITPQDLRFLFMGA